VRLLHVRNFPLYERDLKVFVNVNLLAAKVHNLIGSSQCVGDLIRTLAQLNRSRLVRWLI